MNVRIILLVTLIAITGLVGCSQEPAAPAVSEAVSGQSVSAGSLRIEDANNTILFTVDGDIFV